MKKFIFLLICILHFTSLFTASVLATDTVKLTVSVSAELLYNHCVGDDWRNSYCITYNGNTYTIGDGESRTFSYTLGTDLEICTYIEERDDISDIESAPLTTSFQEEDICGQSFTWTCNLVVTENGGRYIGNTAEWEVKYTFEANQSTAPTPTPQIPAQQSNIDSIEEHKESGIRTQTTQKTAAEVEIPDYYDNRSWREAAAEEEASGSPFTPTEEQRRIMASLTQSEIDAAAKENQKYIKPVTQKTAAEVEIPDSFDNRSWREAAADEEPTPSPTHGPNFPPNGISGVDVEYLENQSKQNQEPAIEPDNQLEESNVPPDADENNDASPTTESLNELGEDQNMELIISLLITALIYGLVPVLFAAFRKKPITRGRFRTISICWAVAVWLVFSFIDIKAGYEGIESTAPAVIWCCAAMKAGMSILKKKGLVKDKTVEAEPPGDNTQAEAPVSPASEPFKQQSIFSSEGPEPKPADPDPDGMWIDKLALVLLAILLLVIGGLLAWTFLG